MAITTYEVWMKTSSEKDWEFVSSNAKKEEAMEQAKSIEFTQRIPTKVIREELNEQTERYESQTLYISSLQPPEPIKPKVQQVYGGGRYTPSNNQTNDIYKFDEPKKGKQSQTFNEACFVLLFTLVLAFAASSAISFGIFNVLKAKSLIPEQYSHHCILATFIFFFILIEIILSSKWVNFDVLSSNDEDDSVTGSSGGSGRLGRENKRTIFTFFQNLHSYIFGNGHLRKVIERQQEELAAKRQAELEEIEAQLEKRNEAEALEEKKRQEEIEKQKKEDDKKKEEEEAQRKEQEEQKKKLEEEEQAKKAKELEKELEIKDLEIPLKEKKKTSTLEDFKMPSELEKYNVQLTSFLSVVLKILQEQNTQFNAYARFGIELFLAGACEAVCHNSNLTKQENHHLLVSLLQLLGRTAPVAESLYEKIDEYMLEPHYLTMYKNGSSAYSIYEKNGSHSAELVLAVSDAIQSWIDPDKKISKTSGIITVMFTDIVGSTKMTQEYGDQVAQKLIRKHNVIVRKAIEEYNGTEIKHTGDGIMSSFSWASNALDAAIKIQKDIQAFNNSKPTVGLKVRIGLNSGEPIVEDNDLFGLTVQIAARVCEKCDAEQIVVSNVVKELATGKNYTFYDIGMFDLKGVDNKQNLFSVAWWKSDLISRNGETPEKRVITNDDSNDQNLKSKIEHEIALSKKMSEMDKIEVFENKLEEF